MDLRRRVQHRCFEVIGIGESHRNADAASLVKPVGGRKQAEDQLHRLPGLKGGQVALIMGGKGQPQVVVRRPGQLAVRSPEGPFGNLGGPAASVHFFQIDEGI